MTKKNSVGAKITGRELLPVAKHWWDRGVVAIPVHYGHKRPAILWREWQIQRPEWADIRAAFDTRFYRNIGLLTGVMSNGLTVLDFDKPIEYVRWKRATGFETYVVATGRGFHAYVQLDSPPTGTLVMVGGEVKASGYVVAPPSMHASGIPYRAMNEKPILSAENIQALGVGLVLPEKFELGATIKAPEIPETFNPSKKASLVKVIKDELSLERLLSQYTTLVSSGGPGWFMCCCPFHDDHRPSMWVNTNTGLCKCYKPSCIAHRDKPMDVINVYGLIVGLQNGEAVYDLAKRLSIF